MAILRVAQMGHPVLRQVARPVDADELASPNFQRFLDDMLETMGEYDGAGLAAPQVHESVRVVVLILDPDEGPEFLINPVIRPVSDLRTRSAEGCLSVAGMRGVVDRAAHVRVDAYDRDGKPKAYVLKGFPAVVVQHECDHLDGVLYVDRVDKTTLAFNDQWDKFGPLDKLVEGYEEPDDIDDEIVVVKPEVR